MKAQFKPNWDILHNCIFLDDIETQEDLDAVTDDDYLEAVTDLLYFGDILPQSEVASFFSDCTLRCSSMPCAGKRWTLLDNRPIVELEDTSDPALYVKGDVYSITPELLDKLDEIAGPKYMRTVTVCQIRMLHFVSWMYVKADDQIPSTNT